MDRQDETTEKTRTGLFTRDFVLGFFTLFFSAAAIHSLTPTFPIYLTKLGSSEREIGVLIGTFAVAALVSRLFVGRALEKHSERSVMMFGASLSVISFLAYNVFRSFWPFFMIRFLQGVTFACIDTAVLAAIVGVVPVAYRARALGYLMLAPSLAVAFAAPLSMLIINQFSFTVLFLSGAGLSFCTLVMSSAVKSKRVPLPNRVTPVCTADYFNFRIVAPGITSFIQLFVWGAISAFFPLYAIQCGVENPGHFFTAMSLMMIAGRAFGGRIMDSCSKERFIVGFLPSVSIILVILSFSRTLPMFIIVGALWGMGAAFFVPIAMAHAFEYVGSSAGSAVGTFRAMQDLGLGIGPVVIGFIVPLTGYRVMFVCLAIICLFNMGYFQFFIRRKKRAVPGG